MAIEPAPTPWIFPPVDGADESGIVGVGADLEPGTLLAAYRAGIFPMHLRKRQLAWWSPDPRGVILAGQLRVSRSLRKAAANFEVRIDSAFVDVVKACSNPKRPNGWINADILSGYVRLNELGWAHSVETWLDGRLVGGLYGVAIGGLFAGESMFHTVTDASKVALVALVRALDDHPDTLIDTQWNTPHLASLGATDVPRDEYLERLARALARPLPAAFVHPGRPGH